MGKCNVLYLISNLKPGGPVNILLGIVKGLDRDKYQAIVLTLSEGADGDLREEFEAAGAILDFVRVSRKDFLLRARTRIAKKIGSYQPDILHTHGFRPDLIAARLRQYRDRHCATLHSYVFEDYADRYGRLRGLVFSWIHLAALRSCPWVICCSESLRKRYRRWLRGPLYSVRNGIDAEKYRFREGRDTRGPTLYVSVGHLIRGKDPLTLIRAFQGKEARLLMLGDGEMRGLCESRAGKNIEFLGRVREVERYLQRADYYISASLSEGLPNAVMEAGMCGLKLILSDIPSHREITQVMDKADYRLFPARDVGRLEQILEADNYKTEEWERMKIRTVFQREFSAGRMSRDYQDLYERIGRR